MSGYLKNDKDAFIGSTPSLRLHRHLVEKCAIHYIIYIDVVKLEHIRILKNIIINFVAKSYLFTIIIQKYYNKSVNWTAQYKGLSVLNHCLKLHRKFHFSLY